MKKLVLLLFLFTQLGYSQNNQSNEQSGSESFIASTAQNSLEEQLQTVKLMEMPNISVSDFILGLLITAILSFLLGYVYTRFGNSISNRKQFSRNFIPLSLTTMLIITVVKSSLALSLGLVGALSIIRFRSAIKEPEELAYIFLAISIGLGLGANQGVITVIAITIILALITLIKLFSSKYYDNQNLFLTILSNNPKLTSSKEIVDTVTNYCKNVQLRRIDENSEIVEISLSIEVDNFDHVIDLKSALQNIDIDIKITLLDNKGIIG